MKLDDVERALAVLSLPWVAEEDNILRRDGYRVEAQDSIHSPAEIAAVVNAVPALLAIARAAEDVARWHGANDPLRDEAIERLRAALE